MNAGPSKNASRGPFERRLSSAKLDTNASPSLKSGLETKQFASPKNKTERLGAKASPLRKGSPKKNQSASNAGAGSPSECSPASVKMSPSPLRSKPVQEEAPGWGLPELVDCSDSVILTSRRTSPSGLPMKAKNSLELEYEDFLGEAEVKRKSPAGQKLQEPKLSPFVKRVSRSPSSKRLSDKRAIQADEYVVVSPASQRAGKAADLLNHSHTSKDVKP